MLKQFQTPSIFLGLFLRKLDVQDFRRLAETLPWRLPEFDADNPQFAQLPPNAPPDTPQVRFSSRDGRLMLEVARAKLHFRMMPGELTQTEEGRANLTALPVPDAYERFIPVATRVHSVFNEHFGATASRVGIVTDVIAPVQGSATQRLHTAILNNSTLLGERLAELQIQTLSRVTLDGGINVNRRLHLRSLRPGPQAPDMLLNINVDINTLAEEPYDVTAPELEKFLKSVAKHLDKQIPLFSEKALVE